MKNRKTRKVQKTQLLIKDHITSATFTMPHDGPMTLTVTLRKSGQLDFVVNSPREYYILKEKYKERKPVYVELRIK